MSSPSPNPLSYPPPFRTFISPAQPNPAHQIPHRPVPYPDPLPVIDAGQVGPNLAEACRVWGIFRLVNHGIPAELLTELEDHAKRLFGLEFESKRALFGDGGGGGGGPGGSCPVAYFWGSPALSTSGVVLRRGAERVVDWVEGFNVNMGKLSGFGAEDHLVVSFRDLLEDYGRHMSRLARTIFQAMLKSLDLDLQQHENYLDESTGLVRVYRYPRCPGVLDDEEVKGMEEHTDSSVLSILMQNEVSGLQVLKDDHWVPVEPVVGSLIVNLGDMMQAMSNDEYKSAKHRVRLNRHHERISICYFVFPEETCLIRSSKYKPFSYSDFRAQVQQDVATLGCKVGLDRFKLPDQSVP